MHFTQVQTILPDSILTGDLNSWQLPWLEGTAAYAVLLGLLHAISGQGECLVPQQGGQHGALTPLTTEGKAHVTQLCHREQD